MDVLRTTKQNLVLYLTCQLYAGSLTLQHRRQHEEVCPFKPVQCPEFDCTVTKPLNEIFRHFRLEHHHHFVNAHGNVFNGDIRWGSQPILVSLEAHSRWRH